MWYEATGATVYWNPLAAVPVRFVRSELLDRSRFATREAARIALFEWLETWYNPRRRHSALDYLAPLEYERRWQHEAAIT